MNCLKCSNASFVEQQVRFSPEIKGQIIEFLLPCMVCENCETPLIDTQQMDKMLQTVKDKLARFE